MNLPPFMSPCEKCGDLKTFFNIKLPNDLIKAIRIAKENIANQTLSALEPENSWAIPFSEFKTSGPWDDIVYYKFKCNSCGQQFELTAETYHGSGGEWRPV